jgi:hypothetical protein
MTGPGRRWTALGLIAAGAAGAAALLALAATAGGPLQTRFGPWRISVANPVRPFIAGAILSGVLAALAYRPLSTRRWRISAAMMASVFAVLGVLLFVRGLPRPWPTGDGAVIELYTLHATELQQLLGPYSRFGWHHPGPAMFYALAPFYALSGRATVSLEGGALAVNAVALLIVGWTLWRSRAGPMLSLAICGVLALYVLRVPLILSSAWNPHLPVLPFVALVVVSAAVATGDAPLLPLTAVVASFVAQTHLGLLVVSALIPLAALSAAWIRAALYVDERIRLLRWMRRAAWVAGLVWLLPVAEQIAYRPGNMDNAVRFFFLQGEEGRVSPEAVWRAWSYSLLGLFRQEFALPQGWYFFPRPSPWAPALSVAAVGLLPVVWLRATRVNRPIHAMLAAVTLLGAVAGFWSLRSIRFEIFDHAVFWLSALGAVVAAVIVSAPALWLQRVDRPARIDGPAAAACAASLLLLVTVIGARNLRLPPAPPGSEGGAVGVFVEQLLQAMPRHEIQKPLFQVDGEAWSVMAGVLLQFAKRDLPAAVDRNLVGVFDRPWLPTGDEDALVTLADARAHERLAARPNNIAVAEYGGFFVDLVLVPGK